MSMLLLISWTHRLNQKVDDINDIISLTDMDMEKISYQIDNIDNDDCFLEQDHLRT